VQKPSIFACISIKTLLRRVFRKKHPFFDVPFFIYSRILWKPTFSFSGGITSRRCDSNPYFGVCKKWEKGKKTWFLTLKKGTSFTKTKKTALFFNKIRPFAVEIRDMVFLSVLLQFTYQKCDFSLKCINIEKSALFYVYLGFFFRGNGPKAIYMVFLSDFFEKKICLFLTLLFKIKKLSNFTCQICLLFQVEVPKWHFPSL